MFKQLALFALLVFIAVPASGQKIKHKKGDILVDKVPTFKFMKTSGKGEAFSYAMTDLEGDTLLKFSDLEMTHTQLPYENSARVGARYCRVEAPNLDVEPAAINPISLAYGTRFVYNAKKTEFLVPTGLNVEKWDAY
jgi:hypothetical protein